MNALHSWSVCVSDPKIEDTIVVYLTHNAGSISVETAAAWVKEQLEDDDTVYLCGDSPFGDVKVTA